MRKLLFINLVFIFLFFAKHIQAWHNSYLYDVEIAETQEKKEKALKRIRQAAYEYEDEALYAMGVLYLSGIDNNGKRNPREATIFFSKAAALGYVPAISALADSFLVGDGALKDETQAFKLYKKAADEGYAPAEFNVAVLYRDGIGTKQCLKQASKYFKRAYQNPLGFVLQEAALKHYAEIQMILDKKN